MTKTSTRLKLPRTVSTINAHITGRHERAGIANQEHGCSTVLFGLAQLAQHVLSRPLALSLWVLDKQSFHHGCDNVSRRNSVDADSVLAPLARQVSRQLDDRCFARVVCCANQPLRILVSQYSRRPKTNTTYPVGHSSRHGCDEGHGSSVPMLDHLLGHCLCCHEHSCYIDLEHGVCILGRVLER